MGAPTILPSFAAGELSPAMYGRTDLAKYHVGAALLRNFFVDYRGGASSRQGSAFVGQCKDSTKPNRLIPFQFNTLQAYALVFGDFSMRVVMNGAYVLEPTKAITGISQANPGVLTQAAHGYSNGDLLFLSGIVGMTQLNQRYATVANVTTNTYTLVDMFGVPIDTSAYGAYVSGGTTGRVFTLSTPYAAADLALLKFTQSADVMTLVHPSYAPYTLTRTQHYAWTLAQIVFTPTTPAPTGVSASNNGVGTQYPNTGYKYVVTVQVGGVESLPSAPASVTGPALGQNVGNQNTVTWPSTANAQLYKIYRTQENLSAAVPSGALFGYIGSANPAATNSFIDDNILPDFTNCPPQANNPFASNNNPSCVTYYQQRQVFGGLSNGPETIDFSKSGDFFNMNYAIPSKSDDNIEITIASQQVNAVKHLISMQSLIALTSSGAWKIDAGTVGTAVTPSQIEAVPQAYNGCSDVPPLTINYDILYVQSKGSIVRDLSYNFYVNIYTGTDITVLSSHLFHGKTITEWCYAEEPYKLVWAVRNDGTLLSLTYLKEQDVTAWARHDTAGKYKSICSISEGSEDAVYTIVQRLVNGQYLQYIERFASRQLGGDPTIKIPGNVERSWCVDAGLQYPLTTPAATLTPAGTDGIPTISSAKVVFGGTGYSAGTTISAIDLEGSGAGFIGTPVIVGGVIQSVTIANGGANYVRPQFHIVDPAGTGTGAVISPIVAAVINMSASANIFTSANIGDVVRIANGRGVVTAVPSASVISVNIIDPLTEAWPTAAGDWSITTPVTRVSGLDHLNGCKVSILADGNVEPSQVVVNGAVTLTHSASAITVGLPYQCQLQSLYIDVPGGEGTIQSKRKKINAVTVRMQDSRGLKVGTDFSSLTEFKDRTTEPMGQAIALYTGDHRQTTHPSWTEQGQICVQQDYPLPATVLALIPEMAVGDN